MISEFKTVNELAKLLKTISTNRDKKRIFNSQRWKVKQKRGERQTIQNVQHSSLVLDPIRDTHSNRTSETQLWKQQP